MSSGSQYAVWRILQALGGECVFGVPGTQNIHLLQRLKNETLRFYTATDELSAGFMAVGYALRSLRPGILFTIPGPGFMFALPAIAEAALDSVPIVHIVLLPSDSASLKAHGLQKLDLASISAPLTRRVLEIRRAEELLPNLLRAYREACSGEPGPVMVLLSQSAAEAPLPAAEALSAAVRKSVSETATVSDASISRVVERLHSASRIVLIVGKGAASAVEQVRDFVRRFEPLVACTGSGRGVIPDDAPGMIAPDIGCVGASVLNEAIAEADLVLVLGAKLCHNGTAGFSLSLPEEKLIRIDSSSTASAGDYPAALTLQADVAAFLEAAHSRAGGAPSTAWGERTQYFAKKLRKGQRRFRWLDPRIAGLSARDVFTLLQRASHPETTFVADSGFHQTLARRYLKVKRPLQFVYPADLQTMGFGVPAAIGACHGSASPVILICGDGGFMAMVSEIAWACRASLSLVILVFVDGAWGSIRRHQIDAYGEEFAADLPAVDWAAIARGFGARVFDIQDRILRPEEFSDVISQAQQGVGPAVVFLTQNDSAVFRARTVKNRLRESVKTILAPTAG